MIRLAEIRRKKKVGPSKLTVDVGGAPKGQDGGKPSRNPGRCTDKLAFDGSADDGVNVLLW
jgi:hypothetical protein